MNERAYDPGRLLSSILDAMSAFTVASIVIGASGCGGNVVVDSSEGTGGGSTTSTTTTTTTTAIGTCSYEPPTYGTAEQACVPLDGDVCPFESSVLLDELAAELGVCSSYSQDCCNQPEASEILCSSPPGDLCCYVVLVLPSGICVGRPFTVAGEVRTAGMAARADWGSADPRAAGALDAITRRAIAEGWARDAELEHASVASFARLALSLLAQGAPADLVREAQVAMGDEIRHAELSFALASAYAAAPVGPGALAIDGALGRESLADLAAATAREGCVGETISALIAAAARDAARDPEARAALEGIAADEARHSASSWKLVAWAVQRGGDEVREAVSRAFDEGMRAGMNAGRVPPGADLDAMRAHGRVPPADITRITEDALQRVIRPAVAALLPHA